MKINEKIVEMRSELRKKVIEVNSYGKEEAIQLLEQLGLDNDSATKVLLAYRDAETAKNTAKNIWNTAWQSSSGIDFSNDITKAQQNEVDSRDYFEDTIARGALQIVTNQIGPSEINDGVLNELYEMKIKEEDIANPTLKIAFRYFSKSEREAAQRKADLQKVREYTKLYLNGREKLEAENAALREENSSLRKSYENLQKRFKDSMETAEKYYQEALAQIASLKEKVLQLQGRGVFKTIGDKFSVLFGKKTNELPEASAEIPDTLYIDARGSKASDEKQNSEPNPAKHTTTVNREDNFEEMEQ